jgi:hypothetical protein
MGLNMKIKIIAGLLFSMTMGLFAQDSLHNSAITKEELKNHIYYLASDKMEGRFAGSEEAYKAGSYIASQFKDCGIEPLFDTSYFQSFEFVRTVELTENNSITLQIGDKSEKLDVKKDYITAPFSGKTDIDSVKLSFVGYGIEASKLDYNDYEGLDVKGRIVIALRYSPEQGNPHSKFSEYTSFRRKASMARDNGALGIIFVNGHYPDSTNDKLMEFRYDRASGLNSFAAVHVKRNFVDKIFQEDTLNMKNVQKAINDSTKPHSFHLKNSFVSLKTEVEEIKDTARNVAGIIPGNDEDLRDECLIIGAHYDHLGMGQTGSLYRGNEPKIHNGADDNASGTAGVLELAEKFASLQFDLKRSIVFVAFDAEELGLLGSSHFVDYSPISTGNMAAMINMDMIGRLKDDRQLTVFGTGTSDAWEDLLTSYNSTHNFDLSFNKDGMGPSDHSSFYAKKVPALFFFTGTHTDYHRPSDDPEKINYSGQEEVLNYIYEIASEIINMEEKPSYVKLERSDNRSMGGWSVYVGTIPDYSSDADGFKLSGVSPGSPAEKAGLKEGDIMTKFGDKEISNIYDYVYALKEHVPGDKVKITVNRDGVEKTFEVLLEMR